MEGNEGTRPIRVGSKVGHELSVAGLSVEVVEGPDRGVRTRLKGPSLSVGTAPSGDLVLTDDAVSRRHALIVVSAEGVLVEDLGSTNGTFLDGARIKSAFVSDGSRVKLGSTTLLVTRRTEKIRVVPRDESGFHGLLGSSQAMREVFALIEQLASTDLPVTISGATGTGKEGVARALHEAGIRKGRPFLVLDCGSIHPDLIKSELFGHEKGAYTGAHEAVAGIFEAADGGTVFLDEVGEIPLALQPNLLRVLETREVQRIGSRKVVPVHFRIVSATHRDLAAASREGTFRPDLYFRLAAVTVRLPSLRERPADLELLARAFLEEGARRNQRPCPELTTRTLDALRSFDWPGNVRQLKNAMESLAVLARGPAIESSDVNSVLGLQGPPSNTARPPQPATDRAEPDLEAAERRVIEEALARTGWNRKAAARQLGISHTTLFERLKRWGLRPPSES